MADEEMDENRKKEIEAALLRDMLFPPEINVPSKSRSEPIWHWAAQKEKFWAGWRWGIYAYAESKGISLSES